LLQFAIRQTEHFGEAETVEVVEFRTAANDPLRSVATPRFAWCSDRHRRQRMIKLTLAVLYMIASSASAYAIELNDDETAVWQMEETY